MTGEKKIVGLWRDSATSLGSDAPEAPAEALDAAEPRAPTKQGPDEEVESDHLDLATLSTDTELPDFEEMSVSVSPWRDRIAPVLLSLLGLTWTGFALAVATDRFARQPTVQEWPGLIGTIAIPLTLLIVAWMALLRSSRSEQSRFARVAAGLRNENALLNQSMHSLGVHLADAQKQLADQARLVQQLGLDTVMRLNDSSEKLAANASNIVTAQDQLAQSGDTAMQRMDGLLAGLPRIDEVAQRLAGNFREAGLVAHQQGASLEAKLAALTEQAAKASEASESAAETLQTVIADLQSKGKNAEDGLLAVSEQVTSAHGAAMVQMEKLASSAREDIGATARSIETHLTETFQQFRKSVDESAGHLDGRLASARSASEDIGARLTAHSAASENLSTQITSQVEAIGERLEVLDVSVSASMGVIGRTVEEANGQLEAFMAQTAKGGVSASELISQSETLLLAIDAVTRELDESLPHAFERMASHGEATTVSLAELRPMLEASEMVAQSTLSHVNAVQATLALNETKMTGNEASQRQLIDRINNSLTDADVALSKLRDGADQFADQGGARMIATLDEVRATADKAAAQARETLDALVAGARDAMQATAAEAIDAAFKSEIMTQLSAIEKASESAVAAANSAADRLMRQLITIMDTSANVEQRVVEADQAIAASDRDSLAKQVGLLTESLKSTSIDVTKILSTEVSDVAWEAYLKGDRGVFSRRAVKLVESGDAKEILRIYHSDDNFHATVNQYIHDFEAMLRLLIAARDGSAISVTLLSSDIGKLYVALAQAIDRLRN